MSLAGPEPCTVVVSQLLARHGARGAPGWRRKEIDPTITKLLRSKPTDLKTHGFLTKAESYVFEHDSLTPTGVSQIVEMSFKYCTTYKNILSAGRPLVRATNMAKVVDSAHIFARACSAALAWPEVPTVHVIPNYQGPSPLSSVEAKVNTLEGLLYRPIAQCLMKELPGTTLTTLDVRNAMDMCPFTLAQQPDGVLAHRFCDLFGVDEWHRYGYMNLFHSYHYYGAGRRFTGPRCTGVIADYRTRMSSAGAQRTAVYVDLTNDRRLQTIFACLGIFGVMPDLPDSDFLPPERYAGRRVAETSPFSAHAEIGKLECGADKRPMVRVTVNGKLQQLKHRTAGNGLCTLDEFLNFREGPADVPQ